MMRALIAKDIAPFTKVLAKMDLREPLKSMFSKQDGQKERGELVTDMICAVLENYYKAESELFAFIASIEGKSSDEIASLPAGEFIGLVGELFSEKNLSFFKFAAH